MRFAPPLVVLAVAWLAGCANNPVGGSLLYLNPHNYQDFDCAELKKRAAAAALKVRESEHLQDRAGASAAGPVINAVVYGPDYHKARWELQFYEEQAARKNCDVLPPPNR